VRAAINDRSNSASPPSTVNINLPCGVVESAQTSASDLNPAFGDGLNDVQQIARRSR
jgi:hypothetical protein